MSFEDLVTSPDWRNVFIENRDMFDFAVYSKGPIYLAPVTPIGFIAVVSEGGRKAQYSKRSRIYTVEFTDIENASFKSAFDEIAKEINLTGRRQHFAIILRPEMERLMLVGDLSLTGYELPMGDGTGEQLMIPYYLPPTTVFHQLGDLRYEIEQGIAEAGASNPIVHSPQASAADDKDGNEVPLAIPEQHLLGSHSDETKS